MSCLINTQLPEFSVKAFHDNQFIDVTSSDLSGKWSVLFFYPADFTFVCPTELGALADLYDDFKELGVEIYSVSTDTHFSHLAWHSSSPTIGRIRFPMLADPSGSLSRSLGVFIETEGLAHRGTFLIDPDGKIKISEVHDDGIGRNAQELLRKVQAAQYVRENPGQACPASWAPGQATLTPGAALVGKI